MSANYSSNSRSLRTRLSAREVMQRGSVMVCRRRTRSFDMHRTVDIDAKEVDEECCIMARRDRRACVRTHAVRPPVYFAWPGPEANPIAGASGSGPLRDFEAARDSVGAGSPFMGCFKLHSTALRVVSRGYGRRPEM